MRKLSNCTPEIRVKGYSDDWEQSKLGELCDIVGGGTPSTSISEYWDGDIDWYAPAEISDQIYLSSSQRKITEEGYNHSSAKMLPRGTVLFTSRAGIGKTAILSKEGCTNQGFQSIVPHKNKLDSYFIFSRSNELKRYGEIVGAGSTFVEVSGKQMANMELLMPKTLREQEEIGLYFSHLDHLITLHQQEYDRLICVKKAMLDKMFPQNGTNVPLVRFSEFTEPWILKPFTEIFKERHVIDTISEEYPQLSFTIEEGVIRPEDKKTNKRDFLILDKENKKYLQTEYDDIIYNPANVIYGAIHRNALGKGCVSPIYKIFYTDQDSTFMECIVRHPRFINEISRSMEGTVKKLKTLKPKAFLGMEAYIAPTLEEQKKIGELFTQLDKLIEIETMEVEKLKHIKSACLDKMFV
ncbi:hypothetical protein JCM37173_31200 [Allocoprococcus similis]